MTKEIKVEGVNERLADFEQRAATIEAPPEELKAFTAGLRVGYKKGFEAGYAQRIQEEDATLGIEPSEVLFNKPS